MAGMVAADDRESEHVDQLMTAAAPAVDERAAADDEVDEVGEIDDVGEVDEVLIEEISIDGMCGVY